MAVQSDFLPCLWKVAATEQVGVKECLFRKISASLTSGKSWLLLYRFYLIVFKDTFHGLGLSLKQFKVGMTVELWLCLVFGPGLVRACSHCISYPWQLESCLPALKTGWLAELHRVLSLSQVWSQLLFLSCPPCSPVAVPVLWEQWTARQHFNCGTPRGEHSRCTTAVLAEVQKLASKCLSKLFFWARKRCHNRLVS